MVSGHYVAPSFTQQLQPLANAYIGQNMAQGNEAKTAQLAKMLRGQGVEEINTFSDLMEKDPMAAYKYAAKSTNPQLQKLGFEKMLPEDITLSEGQKRIRINPQGGQTVLAQGEGKAHVVGNSLIVDGKEIYKGEEKPVQIDTGTAIQYREAKTGKILWETPKIHVFAPHAPHAPQLIDTPEGYVQFNPNNGSVVPVKSSSGEPLMGNKSLTEDQGKATGFGLRMTESNKIINNLAKEGVNLPSVLTGLENTPVIGGTLRAGVNILPGSVMGIPTGGQNAEQQSLLQAKRNFITAVLRKESGAVIGPDEYKTEDLKYFPQRGDTDLVIKQKADARELAIRAMKIQAGPGAREINKTQTSKPKLVWNPNTQQVEEAK
jgi:hypothetical protein